MNELARRLIQLRHNNGWTQEELAEILEVSPKTVSRYENGDMGRNGPRPATRVVLAKLLGVTVPEVKAMYALEEPSPAQLTEIVLATTEDISVPELDTESSPPEPATLIEANNTKDVEPFPTVELLPQQQKEKKEEKDGGYKRLIYVVAIVLVGLIVFIVGIRGANAWAQSRMVMIAGQVSCADNLRVSGVYIKAEQSVSGMASTHKLNPSGSMMYFVYTLSQGGAYNVHVGCGIAGNDWLNPDDTDFGSGAVKDYAQHSFICRDTPLVNGNGACYMTH